MSKDTKPTCQSIPVQAPHAASAVIRMAAVAAFVGGLVLAGSLNAATTDTSEPQQNITNQNAAPTQAKKGPMSDEKMHHSPQEMARLTEERIKTLHDKLMITNEQEAKWSDVAKTMRDNEATITTLIEARHQNAPTMTALDDLHSYQDITQAHADGIKKMIASFEPLYDDMSDDQKKNADKVFGTFEGRNGMSAKKHK